MHSTIGGSRILHEDKCPLSLSWPIAQKGVRHPRHRGIKEGCHEKMLSDSNLFGFIL